MAKVIGIDLGTTNCCVAVLEGGTVQIISNKESGCTTPSVVGFTDKDERLVGQIAKHQAVTNAANTLYAVKRLIGGKFDSIEVEKMRETVPCEIAKAANGDAHIRVLDRIYSPPEISALALQRLKEAAERAKCELSSVTETNISLPFIAADPSGPKHINMTLTRDKFEELVKDLVESSVEPCQKALWNAKLQPSDVDKVILVGGQTRSPIITKTVTEVFGKEPSAEINPDEVVAMGAAMQGGALSGEVK